MTQCYVSMVTVFLLMLSDDVHVKYEVSSLSNGFNRSKITLNSKNASSECPYISRIIFQMCPYFLKIGPTILWVSNLRDKKYF